MRGNLFSLWLRAFLPLLPILAIGGGNRRNVIEIVIRTLTGPMETGLKKAGNAVGNFGQAVRGMALAIGTAGIVAFGKQLIELGLQFTMAQARLVSFTGSMSAARAYTRAIQDATRGQVDELQAMQLAMAAVNFGFADGVEATADLTKNILLLSGGNGEAAKEFMRMLANGTASIRMLDNYGLSASRVRARMTELQDATQGLTADEAFQIAVTEELTHKAELLESTMDTGAAAVQRMSARLRDLQQDAAEAGAKGLEPYLNFVDALVQSLSSASEAGVKTENAFTVMQGTVVALTSTWSDLFNGTISLAEANDVFNKRLFDTTLAMGAISTEGTRAKDTLIADKAAIEQTTEATRELTGALDDMRGKSTTASQAFEGMADIAKSAGDQFGLQGIAGILTSGSDYVTSDEQLAEMIVRELAAAGASPDVIYRFRKAAGLTTEDENNRESVLRELVRKAARGEISAEDLAGVYTSVRGGDLGAANALLSASNNRRPPGSVPSGMPPSADSGSGGSFAQQIKVVIEMNGGAEDFVDARVAGAFDSSSGSTGQPVPRRNMDSGHTGRR